MAIDKWLARVYDGKRYKEHQVYGHTKGEARSELKSKLGLSKRSRLPIGIELRKA